MYKLHQQFCFFIDFYVNLILTEYLFLYKMRVKGDKSCRSGRASIKPASYRHIPWRISTGLVLQVLTDTLFSSVHSVNKTLQMLSLHNISFSFIRPKGFFFFFNMQYDFFFFAARIWIPTANTMCNNAIAVLFYIY